MIAITNIINIIKYIDESNQSIQKVGDRSSRGVIERCNSIVENHNDGMIV